MTATPYRMQVDGLNTCDAPLLNSPGPILILGPPGSGKGTQSAEIVSRWRIPRISTGDLLRLNVSRGTRLGRVADGFIKSGQLVPDDLICDMVAQRLDDPDTLPGYVLDGFPRTVSQAIWLDDLLGKGTQILPPIILNMQVDTDCLISRISRRMICPVCGAIYHGEFNPPSSEGICDRDGMSLEQRMDDTLEVLRARIDVYQAHTMPIIERYRNSDNFFAIDGDRPIHHVTKTIIETIQHVRVLRN